MAINWMWPLALSLSLVYLHPIVSIVFLDQELKRRRSTWRRSFHCAMAIIPVALIGMGCLLINVVDLPEDDVLTWQIAQHAGGSILQNVSTHFLVAAHVFLELIHYVVWIVLLPALDQRPFDWSLSESPLGRRSLRWRILFSVLAMAGGLVMAILWGAFLSDYSATRSVYFTVAILHVLAEIPFLLRSL